MLHRPARPCRQPGCPELSYDKSGCCEIHKKDIRQQYDRGRGSASARGYDRRWRRYIKMFLAEHPLCAECQRQGRLTAATVVDHIVPHRGDISLFWDPNNHQPLCKECHDRKTAIERRGEIKSL